MVRLRDRGVDLASLAIVAAITAGITLVSQRWTGFNSPDSEFYASLALFGSDVTDRALEPAYTWTRLGYIAPVRGLVLAFGPWAGFEIWRVLLLLLIVGSVYSLAHIAGRSRWLSAILAVFVGLNTVVLAFVGNTYLTGTVLAGTFAVVALGVSLLGHASSSGRGLLGGPRWWTTAITGLLLGWLVMTNPYAFILATGLWIAVRGVAFVRLGAAMGKRLGLLAWDLVAVALGAAVSFAGFLLAGLAIFPGRNWLRTYLEWNERLDYTVFVGDATTWQRDSALLVVVIALVGALIAVLAQPRRRWAWAALALASANIAITVVLMIVLPGPWLESPTYVAKLWPGALSAIALAFISLSPGTHEDKRAYPWPLIIVGALGAALLVWSGRFDGVLDYSTAWLLTLGVVLLIVLTAWLVSGRWNVAVATFLAVTMATTFITAQVLQNGRGLLGIYGQYPFRSAFVDFSFDEQMASNIEVQRWLLQGTSPTDSIALWTDEDRLTTGIAAMQLWGGYNLVTTEATLDRAGTDRLEELRPSVIAMYAPTKEQIDAFYSTLPPWSLPSDLECIRVPYLGIGTGEAVVCRADLTWVG